MSYLLLNAISEAYEPDKVNETMTVAELIDFLSQCDPDMPVMLGFDNSYTFGGVTENKFEIAYTDDGADWA